MFLVSKHLALCPQKQGGLSWMGTGVGRGGGGGEGERVKA